MVTLQLKSKLVPFNLSEAQKLQIIKARLEINQGKFRTHEEVKKKNFGMVKEII